MAIQSHTLSKKKKILVLVSRGGGGHRTASDSLKQILGDEYEVEVNSVLFDILGSMDPLKYLTKGSFTGEDLYNLLLQRQHPLLLKWMVQCGPFYMKSHRIEKRFEDYLKQQYQTPDLIISPTPYINHGIASVANRWDIPFLILPTDLDGSTFLSGFPERPTHYRFKMALPYDDPEIKRITFHKTSLREDQLVVTGFPVRPLCQKKYGPNDLFNIRMRFNLMESHQTITLVMGAVGSQIIFNHLKEIVSLNPSDHHLRLQINVCVGYNDKARQIIESFLTDRKAKRLKKTTFILPTGLVIHIHGYTPDLIELMAASDLIITKTGSCTINEIIYLGKKLLLDDTGQSTGRYLNWEKFNIPFIQKHRIGYAFTDSKQLLMLIPLLLKYPERRGEDLKLPSFKDLIKETVRDMTSCR